MSDTPNTDLPSQASPIPVSAGIGLKAAYYDEILGTKPPIDWFEVHPENYMGDGGLPHLYLSAIREHYPLSLHGVGMALGGDAPPDEAHLARFRALAERYQPGLVSEHLAWCSRGGQYFNDLLPAPYTPGGLSRLCEHVDRMQTVLGRQILLENPAVYLGFADSSLSETQFLAELVQRSGCGLLLDVNNVYVCSVNLGFDPKAYLNAFPVHAVGEIHLAGFLEDPEVSGARLLIDDHGSPVADDVWQLFDHAVQLTGPVPVLIERDNNIPPLAELLGEARRADAVLAAQVLKAAS